MKLRSTVVAAFSLALCQPTFQALADSRAQSEQVEKSRHRKQRWRREKAMQELNLTVEQKKKVKDIRKAMRQTVKPLRQKIRPKKKLLAEKMAGEEASAQELKALHAEISEIHRKIRDEQFNSLLQIRDVLDPEQRKEMHKMMRIMRHNGGGRRKTGKGQHR